jgi:hypothetical protein
MNILDKKPKPDIKVNFLGKWVYCSCRPEKEKPVSMKGLKI